MNYAIFPIGGLGQRFEQAGYQNPKPFIDVLGKTQLEWSILSCRLNYPEAEIIIGCREGIYEECLDFVSKLKLKTQQNIRIISVGTSTTGAANTVEIILNLHSDEKLDFDFIVLDNDVAVKLKRKPDFQKCDAALVITNSSNPAHSYVVTDESCFVRKIAEKEIISELGVVGNYYFKSKHSYLNHYMKLSSTETEKYMSLVIREMLESGNSIHAEEAKQVVSYGTPEEISGLKLGALSFLTDET